MSTQLIEETYWYKGKAYTFLARTFNPLTGALATVATVSSITAKVYDAAKIVAGEELGTWTVVVASAIKDTLQADANGLRLWKKDNEGWNFVHVDGAAEFTDTSVVYRVEFVITYSNGAKDVLAFNHHVMEFVT